MGSPVISAVFFLLLLIGCAEFYRTIGKYREQETGDMEDTRLIMDSRFVRAFIITHTDFDGFACGSLLIRLLGSDAGLIFTSPNRLLGALRKAEQSLAVNDSVYIADLAMPPQKEPEFKPLLQKLKDRKIHVHWIDHHEWPAGLMERTGSLCTEFSMDTSFHTAAQIIRSMLPEDDTHADKIIRFLLHGSLPEDADWDRTWRLLLSEVSYRRDPNLSEKVLQAWASGKKMGIMEQYLARKGLKREELTHEIAEYKHQKIHTAHQRNFLVIDIRSRRIERDENGKKLFVFNAPQPSIMVGSLACRHHNADFCLILWEDFRYSVYRGQDRSLDFSSLFPKIQTEKTKFKTFGHSYAVSVRAHPKTKNRMKSLLRWKTPAETGIFIEHLKKEF